MNSITNSTEQSTTAGASSSPSDLHLTWYPRWHPALDEALQTLPEMDTCPHELFRLFFQDSDPSQKKLGLVTEHGEPVALAGLRKSGKQSWVPVTQWILPGAVFPAKPGYLMPAIEALGVDIWVAWWRMGDEAPQSPLIRFSESTPTYRLHLTESFEHYWRENSHYKTVRRIRNRCQGLTSAVNQPGAAEWTIRKADMRWRVNPGVADPGLPDRLLAINYLEARGRHFTFSLSDGDKLVGGATITMHGKAAVAGMIYRDPDYDSLGIGHRLIDLGVHFAAQKGLEVIDLGGGHAYKKAWGKEEGTRWRFNLCPELLFRVKRFAALARQVRGTLLHGSN